MLSFMMIYMSVQATVEGIEAVVSTSDFIKNYITDQNTQEMFHSKLSEATMYADTAYKHLEETYNTTQWWPSVDVVRQGFTNGDNVTVILQSTMNRLGTVYRHEPWWPTAQDLSWVLMQLLSREGTRTVAISWGDRIISIRGMLRQVSEIEQYIVAQNTV